jgi:hypothetical protein
LRELTFGVSDIIVEKLWEEAKDEYFRGEYLSAVIIGGACAETAHRFHCRFHGIPTHDVRWVDLINQSLARNLVADYIARVLHRIRHDYRNKWVHVDIDEITRGMSIPLTAGLSSSTSATEVRETTEQEYRSIFASLAAKQEALDCLWLTAITLHGIYGGYGFLFDPAV